MGSGKGGGGSLDFGDMQALINQAAQANRIDTNTPFGSATFSGPGRNQLDVTFSPEQQQLFEGQLGIQNMLSQFGGDLAGQLSGTPITGEGLPGLPDPISIDDINRNRVEDALFSRGEARLQPRLDTERRRLEQQLTNRGIPIGSEAFEREMENFNQRSDDAFAALTQDAILAGGAEQSREAALQQALGGFQAGLRQQGLGERTGLRNQQLFELASVLGQASPQQPSFPAPGQVDAMGAANLSFANAAQQQARRDGGKGQLAGGIGQLGSAAFGFF